MHESNADGAVSLWEAWGNCLQCLPFGSLLIQGLSYAENGVGNLSWRLHLVLVSEVQRTEGPTLLTSAGEK